jgi:hypothetical protein
MPRARTLRARCIGLPQLGHGGRTKGSPPRRINSYVSDVYISFPYFPVQTLDWNSNARLRRLQAGKMAFS